MSMRKPPPTSVDHVSPDEGIESVAVVAVHSSQDASRGSKGFHTQGHTMAEVMNQ
jgi:hypothetical protein